MADEVGEQTVPPSTIKVQFAQDGVTWEESEVESVERIEVYGATGMASFPGTGQAVLKVNFVNVVGDIKARTAVTPDPAESEVEPPPLSDPGLYTAPPPGVPVVVEGTGANIPEQPPTTPLSADTESKAMAKK